MTKVNFKIEAKDSKYDISSVVSSQATLDKRRCEVDRKTAVRLIK